MKQFEGPEKKLEIILVQPDPQLRSNQNGRWDRVVQAGRAQIISIISTRTLDAYLLSESSLFIWSDRILMITCGQTTMMTALDEIMTFLSFSQVAFAFYERKNFLYPHAQLSDFEVESAYLLKKFPGRSYRLGPANHDHLHFFFYGQAVLTSKDTTFQLLMSNLSSDVTERLDRKIFPKLPWDDMLYDHHFFTPHGFSLNAVKDSNYYSIHITPQTQNSYASFETNMLADNVMEEIIHYFQPQKFSLVLTVSASEYIFEAPPFGYGVKEKSQYEFNEGYQIFFVHYNRIES